MKIGMHLASLYFMFDNYESTLDDRIAKALELGCEHLEISNGPSIMKWQPDSIPVTFSVHAEVYRDFGVTPIAIINHIKGWHQAPEYIVWHPNELDDSDFDILTDCSIPCLIENMDSKKEIGRTSDELNEWYGKYGLKICLDIAHIESNGYNLYGFIDLPISAVHVSRSIDNTHCLINNTGMVILPYAKFYVIEGIVHTWESIAREIQLLKKARDMFIEIEARYPQAHLVSGANNIFIEKTGR